MVLNLANGPKLNGLFVPLAVGAWLTGTGASAARSYWEGTRATALAAGHPRPPVKVPVGFTSFPGEIFPGPAQLG